MIYDSNFDFKSFIEKLKTILADIQKIEPTKRSIDFKLFSHNKLQKCIKQIEEYQHNKIQKNIERINENNSCTLDNIKLSKEDIMKAKEELLYDDDEYIYNDLKGNYNEY